MSAGRIIRGTFVLTVIAAFEQAIASSAIIRHYLARSLLQWVPKKAGLTDNLEVYYNASVA